MDNQRIKAGLTVSLVINILLAGGVLATYIQVKSLEKENGHLSKQIVDLRQEAEIDGKQLEYYKSQANYYSNLLKGREASEPAVGRREIKIVAVKSDLQGRLEGVTMSAEAELRNGEGRILINTQPKVGIDLQSSARTATLVAENLTHVSLQRTDIILTVRAKEEVEIVDGPSAGAAITVAIIAAIEGRTINSSIFMTGTMNPDGSIGPVGGVVEKAVAAAKVGAKLFLIPIGESTVTIMKPEEYHPVPGFSIIIYRPEQVNLQQYLTNQGVSVMVKEVANIRQLYQLVTK